jgi:hypothetical protein
MDLNYLMQMLGQGGQGQQYGQSYGGYYQTPVGGMTGLPPIMGSGLGAMGGGGMGQGQPVGTTGTSQMPGQQTGNPPTPTSTRIPQTRPMPYKAPTIPHIRGAKGGY